MDAPHLNTGGRSLLGMLVSTLLLMLALVACMGTSIVVIDAACRASIEEWVPLYPKGEVVDVQHDFLRERAMGRSRVTLYTEDAPQDVSAWYREYQVSLRTRSNTLASVDYRVRRAPDDQGSLIDIISNCAFT